MLFSWQYALFAKHSPPSGKITLGCDNLGVLSQECYPKETIYCSCKHTNLLQACQAILLHLPIQVDFVHVCSHQDSNLPFESLDLLAQLNSMAADLAKQHLCLAISKNISSLPIGSLAGKFRSCSLCNGSKLTSDPHAPVLFSLSLPLVQEHLSCCLFLPSTAFPLVNWPTIGFAFLASPPLYCLWISKFVSGHSAIGHIMLKHGNGTTTSALAVVIAQKPPGMSSPARTPACLLPSLAPSP